MADGTYPYSDYAEVLRFLHQSVFWRRSTPCPPTWSLALPLLTLLKKSDFFPASTERPCHSSALVSCRPCVTTFTGSTPVSPIPARSVETLTTQSRTCSSVQLSTLSYHLVVAISVGQASRVRSFHLFSSLLLSSTPFPSSSGTSGIREA